MITLLNKFDDNYVIEKKDILEIANSFIRENSLSDYLKDVDFDSNSNKLGFYNINTHKIVFNDEMIIKACYKLFDKLLANRNIDENYYTYYLNFYYLFFIYHELFHVIQQERYEKSINSKNLFNYLYEMCFKMKSNDNNFYKKNHDLFPIEIEANNMGYLKAYSILSYTKLPTKESKVMQAQYLFSVLNNYNKINSFRVITPIEKLAELNDQVNLYEIFDMARQNKIAKVDRLNMGLPITPREYDGIVKEKQKLLTR